MSGQVGLNRHGFAYGSSVPGIAARTRPRIVFPHHMPMGRDVLCRMIDPSLFASRAGQRCSVSFGAGPHNVRQKIDEGTNIASKCTLGFVQSLGVHKS